MFLFFFNDTATPEIYTLSLHDALPIWIVRSEIFARLAEAPLQLELFEPRNDRLRVQQLLLQQRQRTVAVAGKPDRKSTRLNSSHANISYAVFCLKKKN